LRSLGGAQKNIWCASSGSIYLSVTGSALLSAEVYFCSKYHCPSPNAMTDYFESKFARLEYVGDRKFNVAYMRHTEQWWEILQGLTLEECFEEIRQQELLHP